MAGDLNYRSVPALPERLRLAQLGASRCGPGYGRPPGKHRRGGSPHPRPGVGHHDGSLARGARNKRPSCSGRPSSATTLAQATILGGRHLRKQMKGVAPK